MLPNLDVAATVRQDTSAVTYKTSRLLRGTVMLSSFQTLVRALMHLYGTTLAQEAERFACNVAMLGCERWLGAGYWL